MRLICLYGPPGVGKLTVGRELAALTGFKLFHNHLTVDLVTAVFPRETAPWADLIRHIRHDIFAAATEHGVDLIYTFAYRGTPEQNDYILTVFAPIYAGGGQVHFVRLTCDRDVLIARVQAESRRVAGKLTNPDVLLSVYNLEAILPVPPHLHLDTTHTSPAAAAAQIAVQYPLLK